MNRTQLTVVALVLCVASAVSANEDSPLAVSARIDAIFQRAWHAEDLQPGEAAGDAEFLRRVTLDLTGIIPEVGQTRAFLADESAGKRARIIEELLNKPRHATHLADVLRSILLPRNVPESTAAGLENWLQTRFRENVPYDELVREILLAKGSLGQSPPVIFYATLDTKPAALAASTSRVFLGVQIRCAECHDHPFTDWSQDDFWSLAAFYARVRGPSQQGGAAQLDDGPSGEVRHPKTNKIVAPRFLDGTTVSTATKEPRRAVLARWITARDNPYFAKAAVNRVWWMMFGRGIVDPVDDLGGHNTATHPEALELLAQDFVASGYNVRRLLRIIANTRLYQLSSKKIEGGGDPLQSYTAMPVRSLSAKQVYDSIVQAAGRREPLDPSDARIARQRQDFLAQLDAPTRKPIEFQGGIPQTLALLNGPFVGELTGPRSGDLVAALVDSPFLSDQRRLETLYLSTLTRLPSEKERQVALDWIQTCSDAGDKPQGLSDVLWSLLNSSEFVLKR